MSGTEKTWYCPRCDRPFATKELVKEHVVKHPDYNPSLHGDIFDEDAD